MQLPPWKRPDNFGLTASQRAIDEINRISHLTPSGPAEVLGSPHGQTVSVAPQAGRTLFATVKITAAVGVGVYDAKRFREMPPLGAGTTLSEASLGTLPAEDDVVVIEPESIGLPSALPLDGLISRGEIVGRQQDTGKYVVHIPPPAVRRVRYNSTTDQLQVAYVSDPAEAQWVDQVAFTVCT